MLSLRGHDKSNDGSNLVNVALMLNQLNFIKILMYFTIFTREKKNRLQFTIIIAGY